MGPKLKSTISSPDTPNNTEAPKKKPHFHFPERTQPGKLPPENFTYTWSNIDVFSQGQMALSTRLFMALRKCCCRKKAPEKKQLLKSVSGIALQGELMAIMGSSGAGKTTLLNILAFRSPPGIEISSKAERSLNGHVVSADELRANCAYVQQDDLFIGTLNTREHLMYQAMLRMSNVTRKARVARVEEVLTELSLSHTRKTTIGTVGVTKGLSGGERKRLAFASEILTDPPMLICDEPTSGLDAFMATSIIHLLKTLASKGKTIVVTIHQPSSELFGLFDKLMLMSSGRVAFLGTPKEAISFFNGQGAPCPANFNPSDFYVHLLAVIPNNEEESRAKNNKICDAFADSGINSNIQSQIVSLRKAAETSARPGKGRKFGYQTNWCSQFIVITRRSWISAIKEPMLVKVKIIQTVLIALFVGWVYFQQKRNQAGIMNINGVIFLSIVNQTFQNMFAVINVFSLEMGVFMRESRSKLYRSSAYFLGKSIAELPIYVLMPLLYVCILWPMADLNMDSMERFAIAAGILILISQVATSFGYFISCASGNIQMALSVAPVMVVPFLLMGGFFLNYKTVPKPLRWIPYISWFLYGNEALMINMWDSVKSGDLECETGAAHCIPNGEAILMAMSFEADNFKMSLWALVILAIALRFLAWFALMLRARSHE